MFNHAYNILETKQFRKKPKLQVLYCVAIYLAVVVQRDYCRSDTDHSKTGHDPNKLKGPKGAIRQRPHISTVRVVNGDHRSPGYNASWNGL
jgi:hypothetical protein